MRIFQWDQSAQDVLDGCYQVEAASHPVDDPLGPPPTRTALHVTLAEGKGNDRKEVWVAADSPAGTATGDSAGTGAGSVLGYYRLRLPDQENRHVAFVKLSVRPEHRRRGSGTGLLRHAARRAAADGRSLL
ncbi:MAG: GNAT family N-acetyltransferase, partial [Trebonia sp.]